MILKILFWSVGTPLLMVLVGVVWLAVRFSWWGLFFISLPLLLFNVGLSGAEESPPAHGSERWFVNLSTLILGRRSCQNRQILIKGNFLLSGRLDQEPGW